MVHAGMCSQLHGSVTSGSPDKPRSIIYDVWVTIVSSSQTTGVE